MIHWIIERAKDGTPIRMWWSSKEQREADKRHRQYIENVERAAEASGLPMPSMREWARKRGLISTTVHGGEHPPSFDSGVR